VVILKVHRFGSAVSFAVDGADEDDAVTGKGAEVLLKELNVVEVADEECTVGRRT
jgi:hypothetical protein